MIEELSNPYYILAFVITPLVAVGYGLVLVLIHERDLRKNRQKPGE